MKTVTSHWPSATQVERNLVGMPHGQPSDRYSEHLSRVELLSHGIVVLIRNSVPHSRQIKGRAWTLSLKNRRQDRIDTPGNNIRFVRVDGVS